MADKPIDHDGTSAAVTVGGSALKWGAIGVLAAFAVPAALGVGLGFVAAALCSSAGAAGLGTAVGFIFSALGIGAGAAASIGGFSYAAVGGGVIGALKGTKQVSRESSAYKHRHDMKGHSTAKSFNDGEIKGIQEGYQLAQSDMQPMMQQREAMAYQKGQESVVHHIQEQMEAQMHAQGAQQKTVKAPGGKEIAVTCESKAKAVLQDREAAKMNPQQAVKGG